MSVDLTYRGADYRIHEDIRRGGAHIGVIDGIRVCNGRCHQRMPRAARGLIMADRMRWWCLACAITDGLLVPVGRSEPTTEDAVDEASGRGRA